MIRWRSPTAAFTVAALFLTVTAAHPQSAKPTAAETKAVRDCAAKYADDLDEVERNCLFKLVAGPCAERTENQANLSQAECHTVEAAIWDSLLNEAYRELRDELDKDQQIKLREMQQAWIASRDHTCEFYHHKIRGSVAVPMAAACMARETERRAMLLKSFSGL
ncbi:MAG TPA: lysozyme inhibitor LprI family protein [Xanthobacteraceae bacterium]|nr:lysozyme inhibitor LprI family protein [Xanthobacteraceae bacterium]